MNTNSNKDCVPYKSIHGLHEKILVIKRGDATKKLFHLIDVMVLVPLLG